MTLSEKIERAFATRPRPAQVALADNVLQLDDDVEPALWFSGRDWHELTWRDWLDHSSAIFFFDPEAFAYYLQSVLKLVDPALDVAYPMTFYPAPTRDTDASRLM